LLGTGRSALGILRVALTREGERGASKEAKRQARSRKKKTEEFWVGSVQSEKDAFRY